MFLLTLRQRHMLRLRLGEVATTALSYLFLIAWSVIALVPFVWMFSSSFKDFVQIFRFPPVFIPNPIVWDNYSRLVMKFPFLRWVSNSALVSTTVTLGSVISCSSAAFALTVFSCSIWQR
jgi:multiple sugar transport system permease protein